MNLFRTWTEHIPSTWKYNSIRIYVVQRSLIQTCIAQINQQNWNEASFLCQWKLSDSFFVLLLTEQKWLLKHKITCRSILKSSLAILFDANHAKNYQFDSIFIESNINRFVAFGRMYNTNEEYNGNVREESTISL